MTGRTLRSGTIPLLAATVWVPIAPAEGSGTPDAAGRAARKLPAPAATFAPPPPAPHEIPADVIVRAFVKAEADALHLVVRVALTSMRDVDFPVRGPGYVDIEGATPLLADQATVWIAGYVTLHEGAARLPAPVVTGARISLPSDPSFADYDRAVAHIAAPPLPTATELMLAPEGQGTFPMMSGSHVVLEWARGRWRRRYKATPGRHGATTPVANEIRGGRNVLGSRSVGSMIPAAADPDCLVAAFGPDGLVAPIEKDERDVETVVVKRLLPW